MQFWALFCFYMASIIRKTQLSLEWLFKISVFFFKVLTNKLQFFFVFTATTLFLFNSFSLVTKENGVSMLPHSRSLIMWSHHHHCSLLSRCETLKKPFRLVKSTCSSNSKDAHTKEEEFYISSFLCSRKMDSFNRPHYQPFFLMSSNEPLSFYFFLSFIIVVSCSPAVPASIKSTSVRVTKNSLRVSPIPFELLSLFNKKWQRGEHCDKHAHTKWKNKEKLL